MDLSIVIVSYRVPALLDACLGRIAVVAARSRLGIETIVVDNASGDDTTRMVRSRHPWVRLVGLELNVGFSAANNVGAQRATGRYLMLLNPDTEIADGACEALVAALESDPSVGIAAPRLDNPDGTLQVSCYPFPSLRSFVLAGTPLPWVWPFGPWGPHRFCDPSVSSRRPVDWACGACLVVSREWYFALGGFDERFFMYSEDVDLCRRSHNSGRPVIYVPASRVTHHGNQSAAPVPAAGTFARIAGSLAAWFAKHRPLVPLCLLAGAVSAGAALGRLTLLPLGRLRPSLRERIGRRVAWQRGVADALVALDRATSGKGSRRRRSLGLWIKAVLSSRNPLARLADRWFRGAAAAGIAVVERAAAWSPRRRERLSAGQVRSVLVLAFYGIGDAIMLTPALAGLRAAFPSAQLNVVCSRRTAPVFERHPAVSTVEAIDESAFFATARRIRADRPDLFVMLHSNLEYYLFGRLCGARYRAGYLWSYRWAVASGFSAVPLRNHERSAVRRGALVARLFGANPTNPHPRVYVGDEERAAVASLLRSMGVEEGTRLVAVNPNKTAAWNGAGRWPNLRWRQVIEWLRRQPATAVLVLAAEDETADVARLLAPFSRERRVVNLAGRLSLRELAATLEQCAFAVTTDSGVMHLSGAVGTPTVALFTFSDVESFASGALTRPVYRAVQCSPCVRNGFDPIDNYPPICRHALRCGTAAGVADLLDQLVPLVEQPAGQPPHDRV